jgi:hypothetical protein
MPNWRPYAAAAHFWLYNPSYHHQEAYTVQNMAALAVVYQSFYGHLSWEAHRTIEI